MLPDLISDLVDNNVINSNKPRITNHKFIRLSAKHTKYHNVWCHQNNASISALYHFSIWNSFISVALNCFGFSIFTRKRHVTPAQIKCDSFNWLSNKWKNKKWFNMRKYENRHVYRTWFLTAFPGRKYGTENLKPHPLIRPETEKLCGDKNLIHWLIIWKAHGNFIQTSANVCHCFCNDHFKLCRHFVDNVE